jgi:hypothetical protein
VRVALIALVSVVVLGVSAPARAQAPGRYQPSDYPVVELVTMGIGSLIWERHGHIALCIRYEDHRQDACYNYGIGDFHHPMGMAVGFFRGTHSFWVGKMNPREMLNIYVYADRSIYVQPLPLTPEQKQKVIDKLERDILEQNRYYAYDHFWDNCTTRVRDVLDGATDGALRKMEGVKDDRTYRELVRPGFFGMRIPLLITDIAMGRVTDRVPTYYERMFLPDYMREAAERLWGVKPILVYERRGPPPLSDGPSGRILFALVILLLTAPAWATRLWGRFQRTGLAVAILPYAFLGFVLTFLAIISPLPYVRLNESCFVLIPFDVLMIWWLKPEHRRLYARIRVGMVVLTALLLLVGLFKQPIWPILLWPLVPAVTVGFLPEKSRTAAAASDTKKPQPKAKKASGRKA